MLCISESLSPRASVKTDKGLPSNRWDVNTSICTKRNRLEFTFELEIVEAFAPSNKGGTMLDTAKVLRNLRLVPFMMRSPPIIVVATIPLVAGGQCSAGRSECCPRMGLSGDRAFPQNAADSLFPAIETLRLSHQVQHKSSQADKNPHKYESKDPK